MVALGARAVDTECLLGLEILMATQVLDVQGLNCPLPILKAKLILSSLPSGERLEVLATDPGSVRDFTLYCETSGNRLVESSEMQGVYRYLIEKA